MTPQRRSPDQPVRATSTTPIANANTTAPTTITASRQVSWWSVHVFVTALVGRCDVLPYAGTPAWCALSDDDPRKLLALAAAGEYHILRMETEQQARAKASRAVAVAADWPHIGRKLQRINEFRRSAPWSRRVPG
jgi:hypothetical protein